MSLCAWAALAAAILAGGTVWSAWRTVSSARRAIEAAHEAHEAAQRWAAELRGALHDAGLALGIGQRAVDLSEARSEYMARALRNCAAWLESQGETINAKTCRDAADWRPAP